MLMIGGHDPLTIYPLEILIGAAYGLLLISRYLYRLDTRRPLAHSAKNYAVAVYLLATPSHNFRKIFPKINIYKLNIKKTFLFF